MTSHIPLSLSLRGAALVLCAALLSSSACTCNKGGQPGGPNPKAATAELKRTGPGAATTPEARIDALNAKLGALVRLRAIESFDRHVELFLNRKAKEGEVIKPAPSAAASITALVGERATPALRMSGNAELMVMADPDPFGVRFGKDKARAEALRREQPSFIAVVPVASAEGFIQRVGATPADGASPEPLVQYSGPNDRLLYVRRAPLKLPRVQAPDDGERVIVSDHPDGAAYGEGLLKRHLKATQTQEFRVKLWPSRLGVTDRYKIFGEDLRQRLGASGHNLLPARVNLINLQVNLYTLAGHAASWPEPFDLEGNFKIRENAPQQVRLFTTFSTKGHEKLGALYEALKADQKTGAPPLAPDALARLSLKLNRDKITDVFRTVMPEPWRMMLTARGEDKMVALSGTFDDLLDHNRGAMTLGFYPQDKAALSPEVLLAWEAMDIERLPKTATMFHKTLMTEFWMPLFLADPTTLKTGEFTGRDGKLKGGKATFAHPSGQEIGACWGVEDLYFYAYYGARPCERLVGLVKRETVESSPPPLVLDADLKSLMDVLYAPPGRSFKGDFEQSRWTIQAYPREGGQVELVLFTKKPASWRALIKRGDDLRGVWTPNTEVDLSDLLSRTGLEQSLYQEPGVMIVGPPGLLGALPPAYFMGLPFALPPAPPSQLREAVLGPDAGKKPDAEKKAPKKTTATPR